LSSGYIRQFTVSVEFSRQQLTPEFGYCSKPGLPRQNLIFHKLLDGIT
jgi:hypothetical protein